eukprot:TRINITY_DN5400_c0_g1_i3.p1 TRINITY_DN5400_c0_g1~~TRINITY_DN5400_c0_g1_i3.p1  ORF type:complete len:110 (+),score=16.49 TRINITY_DN5400_c0_g1_i3:561-890(+)
METIYNVDGLGVAREPEWGRGGTYHARQEPIDPVVLTIDNNQVLRTSSHQSTGWADLGEDTKEGTPAISVATSEHNATVAPPPPTQQQSRFSPVDGTDLDIPIDFDGMD